jgi:DNA-binding response OmpR family regulator
MIYKAGFVKNLGHYGRILLVDDDLDWLEMTQAILSSSQLKVLTARDGLEALSILQEEEIDVAIIDTNMPRMNGVELLKVLCTHFPRIPVIMFFSGLVGRLIGEKELREIGANVILEKSQAATKLLPLVTEFLIALELREKI